MDRHLVNIDVSGKKEKPHVPLSFTLDSTGYANLITRDDLTKHFEEVKRYVQKEINKIPKCKCEHCKE